MVNLVSQRVRIVPVEGLQSEAGDEAAGIRAGPTISDSSLVSSLPQNGDKKQPLRVGNPRSSGMMSALSTLRKRRNSENIKSMLGMVAAKEFYLSAGWLICTMYYLISVPYRICFYPNYSYDGNEGFAALDALTNAFFVGHIANSILAARYKRGAWEDGTGQVELGANRSAIMRGVSAFKRRRDRYLSIGGRDRSWEWYRRKAQRIAKSVFSGRLFSGPTLRLMAEVVATLPLEAFAFAAGAPSLAPWLLNRLLRILFVPSETSRVLRFLEETGQLTNVMFQRFWLLFVATFLSGHYAGCFFFLLSSQQCSLGHACWAAADEITNDAGVLLVSHAEAYNRSFYWAVVTMITVGFGDIVPLSVAETWFTVGTMYVGIFVAAAAVANLTLLMTTVDRARNEFQLKMDATNKYMTYRRLPPWLRARITSFFDYRWKLLKGVDEQEFLESLPLTLRQRVTNSMARKLLQKLQILQGAPPSLLNALVTVLDSYVYSPGDEIVGPGDPLVGVLLLSQGELEVLSVKGVLEQTLVQGEHFGTECLLGARHGQVGAMHECPSLVRSKTFVEVYVLPADSFASVCQHYEGAVSDGKVTVHISRAQHSRGKSHKVMGSAGGTGTDELIANLKGFAKLCVPGSPFRQWWDVGLCLALLFYSVALPLNLSICIEDMTFAQQAGLLIPGYVADALYLADLVLQSRFFFRKEEGLLVMDPAQIWSGFVRTRSEVVEGVVALPVDLLGLWLGARWLSALRLLKFPRLVHFLEYMGRIQDTMRAKHIALGIHLRRFLGLNLAMILACHWVGCIWLLSANISSAAGMDDNWVAADKDNPSTDFHPSLEPLQAEAYLRAVYFAMVSMSTVGYGDIIPTNALETTVASMVVLIGGLLLPAVVGGLAALISSIQQASKEFRTKVGELATFMESKRYPYNLRERVLHYYDYLWSRQGGVQEEQILAELPAPLRRKVAMVVNGRTLRNIPFLNSGDIGRAHEFIVAVLMPRTFLPGDLIVKAGEMGKEMFMIEKGSVHVKPADLGITLACLGQGDYFGESALLLSAKRCASVLAVSYCDTFILSKSDFAAVTAAHPEWRETILTELMISMTAKVSRYGNTTKNLRRCVKLRSHLGGVGKDKQGEGGGVYSRTIHPEAPLREIWDFIMFLVVCLNIFFSPFAMAFLPGVVMYIPLWILDTLLWVDMYLRGLRFALVKEGQLVTDSAEIFAHYCLHGLRMDIISAIPWDIFALSLLGQPVNVMRLGLAVFRLPKVLRAPQVMSLANVIDRAARKVGIRPTPVQLLRLLGGVLLIAHWAGCGLYVLARFKACGFGSACNWDDTWISLQIEHEKLPEDGGSSLSRFVRSFNWGMPTLVVVVIGDVIPVNVSETLYALGWMLLGLTINATIIGNVANLVANLESQEAEFINTADALKRYLHRIVVPTALRSRIDDYLVEIWRRYKGLVGRVQANVDELPLTLRSNVCELFIAHYLELCPFLGHLPKESINGLSQRMRLEVYGKGDVIIQAGETGNEMFWVDVGSVAIASPDGRVIYSTLPPGSFFGETALFFSTERSATVVATEFCELLRLDKIDICQELGLDSREDIGARFSNLKEVNSLRNANIETNLAASEIPDTKLHRLINRGAGQRLARHGRDVMQRLLSTGSTLRLAWETLACLGILYYCVEIPFRLAFLPAEDALNAIGVDYLLDLFFWADLVVRYTTISPVLGSSASTLGIWFKRSDFIVDILATLPWDLIALGGGNAWLPICRLPHMLRVLNVGRHLSAVDDHVTTVYRLRLSVSIRLLMKVFALYFLINHWWACIWFIIHRYAEITFQHTWAINDGLAVFDVETGRHSVCSVSISQCYVRSIHFTLTTLSTTGYGDITPVSDMETAWEWVVVLTGACIFAGTIGAFTAFFQHIDTSGDSYFKANMVTVSQYMRRRDLPSDLQNAIRLHLHQIWTKDKVLDMEGTLKMLSIPLRMEIMAIRSASIFLVCPALTELDSLMQKRISLALSMQICLGGSPIYEAGEAGMDMFFVRKGIIDVKPPTGADVASAGADPAAVALCRAKFHKMGVAHYEGNYFGEWCLLLPSNMRIDSATARTNAELYSIERSTLHDIISYMPSVKRSLFVRRLITSNGMKAHTKVCLVTPGDLGCWKAEVLCSGLAGGKTGVVRSVGIAAAVQRASVLLGRQQDKRASIHQMHVLEEVRRISMQHSERSRSSRPSVYRISADTCAVGIDSSTDDIAQKREEAIALLQRMDSQDSTGRTTCTADGDGDGEEGQDVGHGDQGGDFGGTSPTAEITPLLDLTGAEDHAG